MIEIPTIPLLQVLGILAFIGGNILLLHLLIYCGIKKIDDDWKIYIVTSSVFLLIIWMMFLTMAKWIVWV